MDVFIKVMSGLMMTLEEDEIFMCLAALLCEPFCRSENGSAKISIKSYSSVFSSSEVLGKNTSIRSKLPTAACWSREVKRGRCEANLLYVESDFGTTHTTGGPGVVCDLHT